MTHIPLLKEITTRPGVVRAGGTCRTDPDRRRGQQELFDYAAHDRRIAKGLAEAGSPWFRHGFRRRRRCPRRAILQRADGDTLFWLWGGQASAEHAGLYARIMECGLLSEQPMGCPAQARISQNRIIAGLCWASSRRSQESGT